jgi:hypothetical protein
MPRVSRYHWRSGDGAFALSAALSLLACFWIVLRLTSRASDLVDVHTDHIHHSLATWTFLHRGFDVYRRPFGDTALPYPHFAPPWPKLPVAYPPGMFAIFLAPALLGAWVPMASSTWAKCVVLWIVTLSHLGLAGMWSALSRLTGGVAPLFIAIWILTLRMCLCGFYDAIWLGCAGMSVAALFDRRSTASLIWFAAATLMSYRAAVLVPVAAASFGVLMSGRASVRTKVVAILLTGSACLLTIWTFWVFTKNAPPLSSPVYSGVTSPFLPVGPRTYMLGALGCGMSTFALCAGDLLLAVTVLLTTILAVLHGGPSWHGSMVVVPALLVGVGPSLTGRRLLHLPLLRNVLALWFLVTEEFAFQNTPAQLLELLLRAKFR